MTLRTYFGLPKKIIFCKKSLISNQRPNSSIEFNHNKKSKKKHSLLINMEFQIHGNIQELN